MTIRSTVTKVATNVTQSLKQQSSSGNTLVSAISSVSKVDAHKFSPLKEVKGKAPTWSIPTVTTAGEDSCFISARGDCVGVADGVGAMWSKKGVDGSALPTQLMNYCKSLYDSYQTDENTILPDVYDLLKREDRVHGGSSTFCCAVVRAVDGQYQLTSWNLGDSGFMVLRPGESKPVFTSRFQWHTFNVPFVISVIPKEYAGSASVANIICDEPHHADKTTLPVQRGDVIVMATDGMWSNIHIHEVSELLSADDTIQKKSVSHMSRLLCEHALRKSVDPWIDDDEIPFLAHAQKYGRYCPGGQIDDISVVVSRVI